MSTVKDYFGSLVFDDRVMKATLSDKVYSSLKKTIDEGTELDVGVANAVAQCYEGLGGFKRSNTLYPLVSTVNGYHPQRSTIVLLLRHRMAV